MIIISNNYGIKYLSNLLHVGPCNDMFKEISDTMAHCVRCEMHSEFQRLKENELCIDVYQSNHDGRKCLTNLLQLEPCLKGFLTYWHIRIRCEILALQRK